MIRPALLAAVLMLGCGAGWAAKKENQVVGMAIETGNCRTLVVSGKDRTSDCSGKLINLDYKDGRNGFYFITEQSTIVTFSTRGADQVKPDDNTAIAPIDMIVFGNRDDTQTIKAVGSCRFSNPYAGPAPVTCRADTSLGVFEGSFLSDGKPPEMKRF